MTGDVLASEHFTDHGDVTLRRCELAEPLELEFEGAGCTMRVPFSTFSHDEHQLWLQRRDHADRTVDALEINVPEGDPLRAWIREVVPPHVERL